MVISSNRLSIDPCGCKAVKQLGRFTNGRAHTVRDEHDFGTTVFPVRKTFVVSDVSFPFFFV